MANGASAALLLEPTSAPAATDVPPAATELGIAVAAATTAICQAMDDYWHCGTLDPAIKDQGGTRIAKVATWQLDHELGELEFAAAARAQGKAQLRRYIDANFYQQHGAVAVEAALDFYIDSLLEMVSRVVRDERVFRATRAN
jgi:hypothetical protein